MFTFASRKETKEGKKMSYTENITVRNASWKLEEYIRKIGVKKYLRLEKLCSEVTRPTENVGI